jgi:hypothetical protein
MRTTRELIDALDAKAESGRYAILALVVSFEHRTEVIHHNEGTPKDRLERLNSAIAAGGEPIGTVAVMPEEGPAPEGTTASVIELRLLPEHGSDPGLEEFLQTFGAHFIATLEKHGIIRVPAEQKN